MKLFGKIVMTLAVAVAATTASAKVTTDSLLNIQQRKQYTQLWAQRATMFNAEGVDSTHIVMFGNSLTQGGDWNILLHNDNVVNRGIIGDIIEGLTDRLDCVVEGKPAKIFLLIGVNDVSHDLTADSIVTAQLKLIDTIRQRTPGTKLYIQSLFPINNSFKRYKAIFGKEQVIRDINAKLRPEVEKRGLPWIEIYSSLVDCDGNLREELTSDGLHLKPEGYAIWRDILLPYINE